MDATVLKRSTLSAVSTHPQAQLFIHTSSRCSRCGYFAECKSFFTHVCNLVLIVDGDCVYPLQPEPESAVAARHRAVLLTRNELGVTKIMLLKYDFNTPPPHPPRRQKKAL